ncbi:CHASE domain-containing protein [Qipengyuania aquimaris]|uniref:CHASE domain-containing protein n=1 Tax=Qipengyuania aquimaris TaxID=255984 RepID=UPI001C974757|nr:CHASE domain-containing protein [Qipengyuania aquimaris]MBY6127823.1 CHASE domain-containing protein [Qipengyuania aquimaris]
MRRGQRRRWLVDYPRAVPLGIFLLVAAITALSVFSIESGERARASAELNRKSISMTSAIERRAYSNSSFLRAGAALFGSQGEVTPEMFRQFVSELRLDADYRGAEGIGWAPAIGASEAANFEAKLNEGRIGFTRISPSLVESPRQQLVPILYLQPDTLRNRRALGYDMYSEPTRREAMDEAQRTIRPTASGRITLVQEGEGEDYGFLIYMPVIDGFGASRNLKGFIYSPFNASQFLASAAELVSGDEAGVRLYDIDGGERRLLAQMGGWTEDGETIQRDVDLANRDMLLVVQSANDEALSPLSMITLLFGLAVASLLMVVARLLTQQAQEDSRSLDWFAEQNSIRNSLTRELNHRVKNTLANVLSIVSLTRRRADSLDEFATGIDNRIRALSATHDLLTQSEWGTTPIASVVGVELAPYANDQDHTVVIEGPAVELAPNDALSLGLAIHELATNAAKYGALSTSGGKVEITWSLVNEQLASIVWVESNGPEVTLPKKRGFGTDLIEKIVAHELRHPVELEFLPEGVRCKLLVPVREPSEFELRSSSQSNREI